MLLLVTVYGSQFTAFRDECRWNYMPIKHEVPGSNPGGSNICWGHSSVVEREVSSILVVAKIREP